MKVSECNCLHCMYYKDDECKLELLYKDRYDPVTHYCVRIFDKEKTGERRKKKDRKRNL